MSEIKIRDPRAEPALSLYQRGFGVGRSGIFLQVGDSLPEGYSDC